MLMTTLTVAHRGASAWAPENTVAAVRLAVGCGSDLVELDVQRSKDGALVLLHDTTLSRTTDVRRVYPRRAPWLVGDFTYAELARLDAGAWKSPAYRGEPIPTLEDALAVLGPTTTGLLLELKAPALYPGIVSEVAATLVAGSRSAGSAPSRLVVQSFDRRAVRAHKELAPSLEVGLLGAPPPHDLARLSRWADQVNPPHRLASAAYVDLIHRHGMSCSVWTVNRPRDVRRVLDLGVDGVITDRPDVLEAVTAQRPLTPVLS